ncbi:baseplate J/gp47 family protein [Campylobacter sp. RM12640]|uniref:baseplate J/gp47 family protein n=1 Tax=unclassified Campylobacter TaxID=2593542 RepID=UPI001DC7A226|nr:baseplate J/gp47 family protein [Campylobacter sp. RM12640]MBZ7983623.1 baseplate J/gp47 family protein [Campylobacter sp. RM12647]MBZ7989762.1 baseplate J/gp47 family protein [Campylobacter sp. RM12635]MBZ7991772.1 baseplate J/gp47 family protein [Campylobacter sp. RM9331]MBZ8005174.1 baseplate J/gp47 family protein [Campylobacter sp. RM9332]
MNYNDVFFAPFDIDKARNEIIENYKNKANQSDYKPLINDDIMILTDCFLEWFKTKHEYITNIAMQNYLVYSRDTFLDELVALVGLTRKHANNATCKIKITANSPTFIPKNTKLSDGKGHYAYLLNDVYVKDEIIELCEIENNEFLDMKISMLETQNIYIEKIEQITEWQNDSYRESDEELKERFKLALHRFSTAGSAESYLFYVLSTKAVLKAKVYDDNTKPGQVFICYYTQAENIEPQILKALENKVPLTDKINLIKCKEITQDLVIKIKVKDDFLFAENLAKIDYIIKDFYKKLDIGESVSESKIISLCNDENISDISITTPLQTIDKNSILKLNSLRIEKWI